MNIKITDTKGNPKLITVNPSDLIIDKKRELGEQNAIWKFEGEVLKMIEHFSLMTFKMVIILLQTVFIKEELMLK